MLRMAARLSRRKSAIVLKSVPRRRASHINSTSRWHSRSRRRLERIPFSEAQKDLPEVRGWQNIRRYCSVTLRPRQDVDCRLPSNFRDQIRPTFRERTMANFDERTIQIVSTDVVPRYLERDAVKVALNWRQRYADLEAAIWDHSKHERLARNAPGKRMGFNTAACSPGQARSSRR